ncbi:hypothetical protein MBLNU459_g1177t2 [Dothideomycetes sp. NU459]
MHVLSALMLVLVGSACAAPLAPAPIHHHHANGENITPPEARAAKDIQADQYSDGSDDVWQRLANVKAVEAESVSFSDNADSGWEQASADLYGDGPAEETNGGLSFGLGPRLN